MSLVLNPYFITLSLLYIFNKFLGFPCDELPVLSLFFRNHFNDLVYIPITLTICLASIRWGMKLPNFILSFGMIMGMVLLNSIIFEFIGPKYYMHATGDWLDVLMYGIGGVIYYVLQKKYVTKLTL